MADDGTDWAEDEFPERPHGAKPHGAKPYGAKPYGAKPYGAKPYGAKPYGAKPHGAKPHGAKPYGAKPHGAKPYEEGSSEPEEWGDEICELMLAHSAVVRLGATVVSSDAELPIPAGPPLVTFRGPGVPRPTAGALGAATAAGVDLNPREWRLEAWLAVPTALFRSLGSNPELSYTLKSDLAEELARAADAAFLEGPPPARNFTAAVGAAVPTAASNLLKTVRDIVTHVRTDPAEPEFRSPGWILRPKTLDALTLETTADGLGTGTGGTADRTLDIRRLLTLDGMDGGTLLGYPFATAVRDPAAPSKPRIFFGADWRDAYVGIGGTPVIVDKPAAPTVAGAVLIRASTTLDFGLRRPAGFAWATSP